VFSDVIVTPSRAAFDELRIPKSKWKIVPNALSQQYAFEPPRVKRSGPLRVLFAGGRRPYKGIDLFRAIAKLAEERYPGRFECHVVGEKGFRHAVGDSIELGPSAYDQYDAVLVLTDNRFWKETFGLIGCEAAARRCVPLFTDAFAYKEIWSEMLDALYLPDSSPDGILQRLVDLTSDPNAFERLRDRVRLHALNVCERTRVAYLWCDLIGEAGVEQSPTGTQ
jgi:glycosyltransferase involved in cell wall biosynthesis